MPEISGLDKPIARALDEEQAVTVLDALVPCPEIESSSEYIVTAIAHRWPARVVEFFGKRQEFARTDAAPSNYVAVPFSTYQLHEPLAAAPDALLEGARKWFEEDEHQFPFNGGRLLSSAFPELNAEMGERLTALVNGGNRRDLEFVLQILVAYEGKDLVYPFVRSIIASLGVDDELVQDAKNVLRQSGVVMGEYGFADRNAKRKALVEPWLSDPSDAVRSFAEGYVSELDRSIASETRSAEASLAQRQLEYGEEVNIDAAG